MTLFLIAFLAGALTIASPCILPVLPFVFARADRPFTRSGLPLLAGMALVFSAFASLATVGGGWVVQANIYGRAAALVLMALVGLSLLLPRLADLLARPFTRAGERLSQRLGQHPGQGSVSVRSSLLLGAATGLLWAPCAGPVLGLVLTGAALHGASLQTSLLLLAYAGGAACSLAAALLAGGRVLRAMKASLRFSEGLRRGLGLLLLASVAAIALGLDTGALVRLSSGLTQAVEQQLLDRYWPAGDVIGASGQGFHPLSVFLTQEST